jgi:hypothetical protein
MTIPNTIKIGSREVQVRIAPLPDNLFGQFDPEKQVITLNEKNSKMAMIETFWHEIIHAINDYNRLDVELAMELAKEGNPDQQAFDLEERITENFAKVFLQVITDNKLLALTAK